jgi:hypothetical protein
MLGEVRPGYAVYLILGHYSRLGNVMP